jgi:hypothetical protein
MPAPVGSPEEGPASPEEVIVIRMRRTRQGTIMLRCGGASPVPVISLPAEKANERERELTRRNKAQAGVL